MSWTGREYARQVGEVIAGADGSVARRLLEAYATGQSPVDDIIRAAAGANPADLHDPPVAPVWMLPLLGAMAGVRIPPHEFAGDAAAARTRIITVPGRRRASPDSITEQVRAVLTGSRTVRLTERAGGDPDALLLETFAAESPDETVVRAAALRAKRVGLILTIAVLAGQTFQDLLDSGHTFETLRDSGMDFEDVRTTLPPP